MFEGCAQGGVGLKDVWMSFLFVIMEKHGVTVGCTQ
jgi:hypothetical protein